MWCAPVQAVVIPIADRHIEPANELAALLSARKLRVEVDASDSRMQNKIRLAQEQKVPYMLFLGDREVEARTVAIRNRAGQQENGVGWDAFIDRLAEETGGRTLAANRALVVSNATVAARIAAELADCGLRR